jgi:hypothetical protein
MSPADTPCTCKWLGRVLDRGPGLMGRPAPASPQMMPGRPLAQGHDNGGDDEADTSHGAAEELGGVEQDKPCRQTAAAWCEQALTAWPVPRKILAPATVMARPAIARMDPPTGLHRRPLETFGGEMTGVAAGVCRALDSRRRRTGRRRPAGDMCLRALGALPRSPCVARHPALDWHSQRETVRSPEAPDGKQQISKYDSRPLYRATAPARWP